MYSKIILNAIIVIFLVIFQLAFISGLPLGLNNINFLLIALIFILVLKDNKTAFWWSIGIGSLVDIYSFLPFGFFIVSFFITILIADFLLKNFFTNVSLYSFLALTFFSTIIYEFWLRINVYIFNLFILKIDFFMFIKDFWVNFLWQIVFNLLFVFILFYIINFISQRLKPVFLVKRK